VESKKKVAKKNGSILGAQIGPKVAQNYCPAGGRPSSTLRHWPGPSLLHDISPT
jgi:hypothetical protein